MESTTTGMYEERNIKPEPMTEDVCSFCHETFFSTDKISGDEDLLEQLTFLIVSLNISALRNTVICRTCSEKIRHAYNFKKSYVTNFCKTAAEIDTKIFCVCHLCKDVVKKSFVVSLSNYRNESKFIIGYLTDGLDFDTSNDSHICISCQESISNFYSIMKVLSIYDDDKPCNEEDDSLYDNLLNNEEELEIKPEPSGDFNITCDYSTENVIQNEDIKVPMKQELEKGSEKHLRYEEFICKNEELDLKTDLKEGSATEEMWKNWEENTEINLSNLATQYFNSNYQNKISAKKIKTFTCNVCGFQTKYSSSLRRHVTVHEQIDDSEKLACDVCEYKTRHKAHLQQHLITHKKIDEIETFKCEFCSFRVKRKGNLKKHVRLIHNDINEMEMFQCEICQYRAKTKQYLKQHQFIHKNLEDFEVIYTCDICGHQTKTKGNLKQHSIIHKNADEIKMFNCEVCDYKAKRKDHLQSHMLTHKSADEIKMFKCDTCDYKAKRKDILKLHLLNHKKIDEVQTFTCDICKYRTKRKGHLRSHIMTHLKTDKTRTFRCKVCKYKSKSRARVRIHMLIHKNEEKTVK